MALWGRRRHRHAMVQFRAPIPARSRIDRLVLWPARTIFTTHCVRISTKSCRTSHKERIVLLGFFRVPFRLYLTVSMGCTGLIASGVVLSGAGVAKGNLTPVVTGVALIVLGFLLVQMLRQRLRG